MTNDPRELGHTTHQVPKGKVRSATAEVPPLGNPQLLVLVGTGAGRGYPIGERVSIGRGPDCEVWIPNGDVSRSHATVHRTAGGEFVLRDVGSANGTAVNGKQVQEHVLALGDMIGVAVSTVLMFTHHDPVHEQFTHLQKMEALGQLAGGVAHDFNNLLAVVANNAQLLLDTEPDRAALAEYGAEILQAVERGAVLTKSLLDFARSGKYDEKPVDVTRLLEDVTALARRTFDRAIEIETQIQRGLCVIGDRLQLFQVAMNLLLNAQDALPGGGRVEIDGRVVDLHDHEIGNRPLQPGRHVRLSFVDNGIGMDEATRQRIFEPFFTTKDKSKGTGLGLSMAYGIIQRHRGHIEVAKARGEQQGAELLILIPLLPESPTQVARRSTPTGEAIPLSHGCILVVDDDELVLKSTTRLLRSLGYETLTASDGADGVVAFEQNSGRIDLVLLDLVMPNLGGTQAFHVLRKLDPKVRVVLTSGYTEHQNVEALLAAGAAGFVPKPLRPEPFKRLIADILSTKSEDVPK